MNLANHIEEHIGDLNEVARPDGFGLIVQEA